MLFYYFHFIILFFVLEPMYILQISERDLNPDPISRTGQIVTNSTGSTTLFEEKRLICTTLSTFCVPDDMVPKPGLRIRSIFGRIRILQIRILKSDTDPGSYWLLKNQFKHQNFFHIKHISSDI